MMRQVLTKEEANELIEDIPNIPEMRIGDEKYREMKYKEAVHSCDCRQWVSIIKTLYTRLDCFSFFVFLFSYFLSFCRFSIGLILYLLSTQGIQSVMNEFSHCAFFHSKGNCQFAMQIVFRLFKIALVGIRCLFSLFQSF